MHSLKNTFVAVGLLGLSFVFYQFSEPSSSSDGELMRPLASADADPESAHAGHDTDGDAPEDSPASAFGSADDALRAPDLEIPDFDETQPDDNGNGDQPLTRPLDPPPSVLKPRPPSPLDGPLASDASPPMLRPLPLPATESAGESSASARDRGLMLELDKQRTAERNDPTQPSFGNSEPAQPPTAAASTGLAIEEGRDRDPMVSPIPIESQRGPAAQTGSFGESGPADFGDVAFEDAFPLAKEMVAAQQMKPTLELLSQYYHDSSLTQIQHETLVKWLDALAGKVIWSTEHHLAEPYTSQAEDSLQELGRQWKVPGQLVYNVNQIQLGTSSTLPAGTKLKQIPGPFRAVVDRERETLTLFLGDLYAGRFDCKIGIAGKPGPGSYAVVMKARDGYGWKNANETVYPPGDPNNHYGQYFVALEGQLCIHAVPPTAETGHLGCLGLAEADARDLFAILSQDSIVEIR